MPALSRATGIAAVALVAAVGLGGFIYSNSKGAGGGPITTPQPTAAPTLPPGIPGWTTYTSKVYGFTMSYPSDWSVGEASTTCPEGRTLELLNANTPCADTFVSPGDDLGMRVWQMAVPEGVTLDSAAALDAAFPALCANTGAQSCELPIAPTPVCAGMQECRPAIVAMIRDTGLEYPFAYVAGPQPGFVTVFWVGRVDSHPAAAIYGGSVALLKAIVSQVAVP